MPKAKKVAKVQDVVTRDYTIHMKKRLHGTKHKKGAPRSVKEVKAFAKKMMGTEVRRRHAVGLPLQLLPPPACAWRQLPWPTSCPRSSWSPLAANQRKQRWLAHTLIEVWAGPA